MFLIIAFLGGMISLLSPCTLPVIPLLFAGFRGNDGIFWRCSRDDCNVHLVALVATAASNWIAQRR